jgi:hypothetical protein
MTTFSLVIRRYFVGSGEPSQRAMFEPPEPSCFLINGDGLTHAILGIVFVVHGTRKFLDRVGRPTAGNDERSTTALGAWYATVLFWKVALFVNETTLVPVLMSFAPAVTVVDRFPDALDTVREAHGIDRKLPSRRLPKWPNTRSPRHRTAVSWEL